MRAKTHDDIRKIHDSLETVKRLSDRIIGIGPINIIGLDGILSWLPIPFVDEAYSLLSGLFILWQGVRARADFVTLVVAFIALFIDGGISLLDGVWFLPLVGSIADTLFQGQLYAAHMIQKDMEKTLYIEGSASEAHRSGEHASNVVEMRTTKGKKRVVYLG
ncbi:MAG: DUF4112 domain-containing protein [Asticcacaulis sp.]